MNDKITEIKLKFAYESGRWAENECILDDIAFEEFSYIENECNEIDFKYEIDFKWIKKIADEYNEKLISEKDIINKNINKDNLWQFDFLANDIKEQLINFLKKQ